MSDSSLRRHGVGGRDKPGQDSGGEDASPLRKSELYATLFPIGGSGQRSSQARGERKGWRMRLRRFAHNLRRKSIFFIFFARNPLKSPDSDE
jgi:hypothetical protein